MTNRSRSLVGCSSLPPIRFHDLRHTFATLQLAAGTNPKIVSEVLGHKEIAITLDRYSHALPTMQATAMARLDAILGRGDDAPSGAESDKGSTKGSPTPAEASERPDPSVDRAGNGEIGTAYRMLVGSSHAAHHAHQRFSWDAWATWVASHKGSNKGSG